MKSRKRKADQAKGLAERDFAEVFELNYDVIFRYLRRRVNGDLAADLTAETFSTALKEFHRFDSRRGSIRAWLFGIATNKMKREARREERELRAYARTGLDRVVVDPMVESDRRLDAQRHQRELAEGLASLQEADREAILLLCWGDLSYPEIAEALQVPLGTVKSRIARARKCLKQSLTGSDDSDKATIGQEKKSNG